MARHSRRGVPQLSLVLPCFNEEELLPTSVERLARAFARSGVRVELVLVDNGSTDGTADVIAALARAGLPVVKRTVPVNRGYGLGVLTGLAAARGRLVGFMAADSPVDAEDVIRVYDGAARATRPLLAKAVRRFRMDGALRRLTSRGYNVLVALLFPGLGVVDVNATPKILPREALRRMRLESRGSFLDFEVLLKARRLGLRILEVSVFDRAREAGSSHVRPGTVANLLFHLVRYRFGAGQVAP